MTFYLGTDEPSWLQRADVDVPLFVSARRLRRRRTQRPATHRWALDSGGFTELGQHGKWETTAEQYAHETARWRAEIGRLDWAAPQDWMCEPSMLAKTGLTVREHQARTIDNFLELDDLLPATFVPVLQGWELGDYLDHVDAYSAAGVDLTKFSTVGVGSICRRGQDTEVARILHRLASEGIRCHGFGVRTRVYRATHHRIASADSMAWSYNARRNPPLPGCSHASCNHCPLWARRWRARMLNGLPRPLFDE